MNIDSLINHLAVKFVPAEQASIAYGNDTGGAQRQLLGAIIVKSAAAVGPLLKLANLHRWQFWPISGGRNFGYGTALPVYRDAYILDLRELKNIEFHAESQSVTVDAGVTQQDLRDYLDKHALPYLVPTTGAGPSGSLIGNALDGGYGLTPVSDHFDGLSRVQGFWGSGVSFDHVFAEQGAVDMAHRWPVGVGPDIRALLRQSNLGVVVKATIQLARVPDASQLVFIRWPSEQVFLHHQAELSKMMEQIPQLTGVISMHSHRTLASMVDSPLLQAPHSRAAREQFMNEAAATRKLTEWLSLGTLFGTKAALAGAVRDIRHLLPEAKVTALSGRTIDWLARGTSWLPNRYFGAIKRQITSLTHAKGMLTGTPVADFLQLAYCLSPGAVASADSHPANDGVGLLWHAPLVPLSEAGISSFIARTREIFNEYEFDALLAVTARTSRVGIATIPLIFDRSQDAEVTRAHACLKALQADGLIAGTPPYRVGIESMAEWHSNLGSSTQANWYALKRALDYNFVIAPGRYIR